MLNTALIQHSTLNIQHSSSLAAYRRRTSPPEFDPRLAARLLDHFVRLFAFALAQHLQHPAREDAIEEALAIGVGWQDAFRIGAKAAEEVVDLRVFAADELLQVLFQRASKRGRFAAGRDGDLNRSAFDNRRHDEFAKVRDVDDIDRDPAAA